MLLSVLLLMMTVLLLVSFEAGDASDDDAAAVDEDAASERQWTGYADEFARKKEKELEARNLYAPPSQIMQFIKLTQLSFPPPQKTASFRAFLPFRA